MDSLRLGELCAATSLFTDLGTGQPMDHGLRTCLVSMRLAEALGLNTDTRRDVFFVSLLRFLGCTADSYQVAELLDGDEAGFFSIMAPVTMGSSREELGALIRTTVDLVGFPGGLRSLAGLLSDMDGKNRLLDAHCEVASRLASDMGLPSSVVSALDMAYARWDGQGVPHGVGGEDVPASIQISVVARDLELWGRRFGRDQAVDTLGKRRGQAYAPAVVDAALELGVDALRRCDDDLWDVVVDMEPTPGLEVWEPEDVGRSLQALGDFADLKVPEFTGHSRRVSAIASKAAEAAGMSGTEPRVLGLAGSVHDLGVVAIPARVWRRSEPSPVEEEQARLHPIWSERLLRRVDQLDDIAALAGRHHERLDGAGYPAGLHRDLGRMAGLLICAELYDEELRRAPVVDDVAEQMMRLAGFGSLSSKDVSAVLDGAGAQKPIVEVERPAGLTEREVEVLRLLATGNTNRQIAKRLGISVKTVGSHVEHTYTKAGVRTRAAATLFAVKNDLV